MNQWNQLTDIFGRGWDQDTIPECAADNICIAWPSLIACIDRAFAGRFSGKALDFGCGGGLFCRKLHEMGFAVTGYDEAAELLESARRNTPPEVTLTASGAEAARNGKYELITSIMVLQFIADIDSTTERIASLLKPGALTVHAVFNPEFLKANSGSRVFSGFSSGGAGFMELKEGIRIPVHNRTAAEYRRIFAKYGCEEVYLDYPPFSEEFLDQYRMPFATEQPEYLVQAFRNASA
ncbi:class I SAM-dependent methyltransferase [Thiovibrio sp. JS02]